MSRDRASLWQEFGAPNDQLGSVNEPRTCEEHGVVWNEKWIYRGETGQAVERIVLFNRYDFVGVFRILPDGSAEAELLPES